MDNFSAFTNFFVSESIDIAELGDGTQQSVVVAEMGDDGFLTWHTTFVIDLPQYEAESA